MSRYSLLAAGIFYGKVRYDQLKKKEDERRAKEEAERPAKEAAMKAEKERKNQGNFQVLVFAMNVFTVNCYK